MTTSVIGRRDWSMTRDTEGHRNYKIKWLCFSTSVADGPAHALVATGLPALGSGWAQGNDIDTWAKCLPNQSCRFMNKSEKGFMWEVEQTFSTKPLKRCQDDSIENPLNEPDQISGGFSKYTEEIQKDKDGDSIKSSSHERIRGATVEFDANRPTVSISKNVLTLPLSTFAPMVDTVNDAVLWGLPKRCVKLSDVTWSRQLYGTCTFFYTITYGFDCRYDTFDRVVFDEGTKILNPEIANADKTDPKHFIRYKDVNGDYSRVFLDGNGAPLEKGDPPVEIDIEYYTESNFLTLGIPATL
tara:strand:- start:1235 stop:2131 length:897 start_codon:yes stop_codon:yes gene_type:complete